MKILHIIVGLHTGGAEGMLFRLIRSMPLQTHVVISLTSCGPLGNALRSDGYTVHEVGLRSSSPFRSLLSLWRLIRTESPDIIQTWMYHADFLGGVIGRLAGFKNIVWNIRNTEIPQGKFSFTALVIKICALLSSSIPRSIICCANAGLHTHARMSYDRSRMIVIPNGYDTNIWKRSNKCNLDLRRSHGIPDKAFIVGVVGRFDRLKGYDIFIEAASRIAAENPSAIFLLIGRNVDEKNDELNSLIKTKGDGAVFHLKGERGDVAQLMSMMDVYCLPSRAEGFPNVVAEAMLMEVPCVVSNVGDAALIVGETGTVVPALDPDALAAAVIDFGRLDHNTRRAFGTAARARIVENYGIHSISKKYENLYNAITKDVQKK